MLGAGLKGLSPVSRRDLSANLTWCAGKPLSEFPPPETETRRGRASGERGVKATSSHPRHTRGVSRVDVPRRMDVLRASRPKKVEWASRAKSGDEAAIEKEAKRKLTLSLNPFLDASGNNATQVVL